METLSSDGAVRPATLGKVKEEGSTFHCDLYDAETVYKIAQEFLTGLASACVDNTTGGLFKSPASVAVDIRREMVEYLIQRSETFVAESIVLEGTPDIEVSANPFDIISDFIDDFAHSKRNLFSHVSAWLLSDKREDRIDIFVQEMELNGFWLIDRRAAVAKTLLRNVDFKTLYHCNMKFKTEEELEQHVPSCSFRVVNCVNEGCNALYSAGKLEEHDSTCPFKILLCEQKCADSTMRRDMDRHCITVCPMKLVNCPFYPVGCLSTIPQCTIGQHRAENLLSRLIYILKVVHKEASLEALKERTELLEKALSPRQLAAAQDARSLTFAIKDRDAKLGPLVAVKKSAESDAEDGKSTNEKDVSTTLLTIIDKDAELALKDQDSPKYPKKQNDFTASANNVVQSPVQTENVLQAPSKNEDFTNKQVGTESSESIDTKEESTCLSTEKDEGMEPLLVNADSPKSPKKQNDYTTSPGKVDSPAKTKNYGETTLENEEATILRTEKKRHQSCTSKKITPKNHLDKNR